MYKQGVAGFKYFAGISSLAQIVTREDRVCVLNILGSESSEVTPVGHAFSGGNVVFGTSPGRRGQSLATPIGDIPVYNSVREGLDDGHHFNCGVVYLPPAAARDGVAELIRVNRELTKIFIITEKVSVHDAREIRAMAQQNGIDVFGANCLGVADTWNQVRIGGALGGDNPNDALKKGSIAILSNSGGFTTTIAQYLRLAGWGTTTLVSSGKDVYIHYAAPEFAVALANDARSKAAVLYCEPGGFYELDARFTKPVVACIVGRWKSRLTRAVGHAGAMGGGDDDAAAKERWFMEKFGVDAAFTAENPVYSSRGALVTNIADIPAALTAVMRSNATLPDFAPEGTMELKPWFGSAKGVKLPASIDLPVVEAIAPYNMQIANLAKQSGAVFPRQVMKDASGASQMDALTQITRLHGMSVLDAGNYPLESLFGLALLREPGGGNDRKLVNVALGASVNLHGDAALAAAQAAREAGSSPCSVLAAAACIVGPQRTRAAGRIVAWLIERFAEAGVVDAMDESFNHSALGTVSCPVALTGSQPDAVAEAMLAALRARGVRSVFVRHIEALSEHPTTDAVLAAIATSLAWGPLMRKRISRITAESLPWWVRLMGVLIGASAAADRHAREHFCGLDNSDILERLSLTEVAYVALLGERPAGNDLSAFQMLLGVLLSNGPGTISSQGAKGAVSADGPETPERVQINKAVTGFLTHTGYAHGGNGYEGVAFLIEQFRDSGLSDPADPRHGIDLKLMAARFAEGYARDKAESKSAGSIDLRKIPGVNHPVFKGNEVNEDPRTAFIMEQMRQRGEYNIFLDYYHQVVAALHEAGVTPNVYCVNVDAVIAALLLKIAWRSFCAGGIAGETLESAAFTLFLYARMLGCAAEIDDHLNRGRNMDTRTPASHCAFVA